jgi:molybdate transport system substrate-binding protein
MSAGSRTQAALSVFCAGAAKGVVAATESAFTVETGAVVEGTFGAVGALREKLLAGEPCDVIVLTAALIMALEKSGHVVPGSAVPLGAVRTGIAVRAGEFVPRLHDAASLRATLTGASRLLISDPQRATAGIHFVDVLKRLDIFDVVVGRIATFPNGATAMQALAQSSGHAEVGCTQVTEINYTPGVVLAGPLPKGFDLATVYSAAVGTRARAFDLARRFVQMLGGTESRDVRARGGFDI